MKKKRLAGESVLFVNPDYHCSFILRDELRNLGWKSDIYVPAIFPDRFLFENTGVVRAKSCDPSHPMRLKFLVIWNFLKFMWLSTKFRYQVHYGALCTPIFIEQYLVKWKMVESDFHFGLWLLRRMGKKIIYVPSGCRDEEMRSVFELLDNGNVCGNCGFSDRCNDENIEPNLRRANRFANLSVGYGFFEPSFLTVKHIKYKSIDLSRWNSMSPKQTSNKIRVLHSHSLETRGTGQLNIKASPLIVQVMRQIERELPHVEFVEVTGLSARKMLYEQQKADIIIDQLRYGHWGSSGVEAMALGKVLVCYLRPEWKEFFLSKFPEHQDLPVVNATVESFYKVMVELLNDPDRISRLKKESRAFAEAQYNAHTNAAEFTRVLKSL
jgi:glycosyltransferase involved in cell wall biosynthesis